MKRRAFLSAIAAFAATAVLDPERALWVPGKKTISIPKAAPLTELPDIIALVKLETVWGDRILPISLAQSYSADFPLLYGHQWRR